MITRDDIESAVDRIAPHVRRTPILSVDADTFGNHPPLVLKLESLQHAGSFKVRGAFNGLLSLEEKPPNVATASGGNHGAAVAYAAMILGIPATIFVPEIASPAKIKKIEKYGADVRVGGARYADAAKACADFLAETGGVSIHAYDQETTISGQGTLAREWDAEAPDLKRFSISVGGGGLIGGFAAWLGSDKSLIAAETDGTSKVAPALEAGEPVNIEVSGIAADSLGARAIGGLSFGLLKTRDVTPVSVSDDLVKRAQRALWDECRFIAEPGAATALAAVIDGQVGKRDDAPVGVLICGANIALEDF